MELKIIKEHQALLRNFVIYGSIENPLFKAKDIAEWLDLTNVADMISRVDSGEVTKLNLGGLNIDENPNTQDSAYLKSRVEI